MSHLDKATIEQLWKDPDSTCPKCSFVNRAIRDRCRNFSCDFDWDVNGGEFVIIEAAFCEVAQPGESAKEGQPR